MLEYELVIFRSRSEKRYGYSIRTIYRGPKDTRKVLGVVENSAPFGNRMDALEAGMECMKAFIAEQVD